MVFVWVWCCESLLDCVLCVVLVLLIVVVSVYGCGSGLDVLFAVLILFLFLVFDCVCGLHWFVGLYRSVFRSVCLRRCCGWCLVIPVILML